MKDEAWDKMAEILKQCDENQTAHNVDPDLAGLCEQCPVSDTCPVFRTDG